jgi:hypothetical protein
MKYMLILSGEEGGWEDTSPEDMKAEMDRWQAYGQSLVDAGAFLAGEGLQESATATTVRVGDDDERLVTDGPFAETKEALAGFYLIDARDLNEAIQIASKIPPAKHGSIEIRPTRELVVDQNEVARFAAAAAP